VVEVSEKWVPQRSSQGLSSSHLRDRKKRGSGRGRGGRRRSPVYLRNVECSI